MTTVGLVGGLGPESTIDYYRRLLEAWEEEDPSSSPSIVIDSLDVQRALRLVAADRPALIEYLSSSLQRLAGAGVDFIAMTANTAHIVFDELEARSPVPMLSIVEVCAAEAQRRGLRRLALLGTRFTMEAPFYPQVFARRAIEVVPPEADERARLHARYVGELLKGDFREETRREVLALVERLRDEQGVDGIIFGGTELPLLLPGATIAGLPVLDTTALHVAAIVARLRNTAESPSHPPASAPMGTEDQRSPEACVQALYDVISGPPEAPRDWDRFRALCRSDARFLLATRLPDGTLLTQSWDVNAFVEEGTSEFARHGLWERELVGRTERFGRVAHVFSSYESRIERAEAPVVVRGVNSIQLVEEAGAWRIAHLAWDRVLAEQPLPADLMSVEGSRPCVAVVGPGVGASGNAMSDAQMVGRLLAEGGCVTLTGGVAAGVMAAASAGASAAGGLAIGVLPGADRSDAASGLTIALPTGLGEARNAILVTAADAVIGCGINPGTASELALALRARKPTALVRPDAATVAFFGALAADAPLHVADSPEDAVAWVVGHVATSDAGGPR